ncbi:hypothetical protein RM555_16520 [Micromonospora sp. DSM 115977]|uniref:Uncharacterized protein n=1 Tax=Micromonospora reichwaldensis TaxID=3075516 RepID=A0ABU2WZH7_9ACTN|nr:hypothetical protein [Micromonospora sp. DSM 115977]MDT0530599.1 hypothetical protein [Micromonospora sp. DSM 115977]
MGSTGPVLLPDPATDYLRAVGAGKLPADLPADHAVAVLGPELAARTFPRPMFVAEREIASFYADFEVLLDVVGRLPDLLAGGSLAAFGALTDAPAAIRPMLVDTDLPRLVRYGRADVIHDGTGFKVIELGLSTAVGGVRRAPLAAAILADPRFGPFAERHGLRHLDSVTGLVDVLDAAAPEQEAGRPGELREVLMVEATGALAEWAAAWQPMAERIETRPFRTRLAEIADLSKPDGTIADGLAGVSAILRLFSLEELAAEPEPAIAWRRLHPAADGTTPPVVTVPAHDVFNSKSCLALVQLPAVQGALTEAERASLRRILPPATRIDASYDLTGLIRDRSDNILKPTTLARGEGTVAGWTVDDTTWRAALTTAARDGRYIVQRRVVPRIEPGYDEQGGPVRDWHAVWGLHYGPAGLTGLTSRLVRDPSTVIRGTTERGTLLAPVLLNSGSQPPSGDRRGTATAGS